MRRRAGMENGKKKKKKEVRQKRRKTFAVLFKIIRPYFFRLCEVDLQVP